MNLLSSSLLLSLVLAATQVLQVEKPSLIHDHGNFGFMASYLQSLFACSIFRSALNTFDSKNAKDRNQENLVRGMQSALLKWMVAPLKLNQPVVRFEYDLPMLFATKVSSSSPAAFASKIGELLRRLPTGLANLFAMDNNSQTLVIESAQSSVREKAAILSQKPQILTVILAGEAATLGLELKVATSTSAVYHLTGIMNIKAADSFCNYSLVGSQWFKIENGQMTIETFPPPNLTGLGSILTYTLPNEDTVSQERKVWDEYEQLVVAEYKENPAMTDNKADESLKKQIKIANANLEIEKMRTELKSRHARNKAREEDQNGIQMAVWNKLKKVEEKIAKNKNELAELQGVTDGDIMEKRLALVEAGLALEKKRTDYMSRKAKCEGSDRYMRHIQNQIGKELYKLVVKEQKNNEELNKPEEPEKNNLGKKLGLVQAILEIQKKRTKLESKLASIHGDFDRLQDYRVKMDLKLNKLAEKMKINEKEMDKLKKGQEEYIKLAEANIAIQEKITNVSYTLAGIQKDDNLLRHKLDTIWTKLRDLDDLEKKYQAELANLSI